MGVAPSGPVPSEQTEQYQAKVSVRTSKIIIPKAYISLAVVRWKPVSSAARDSGGEVGENILSSVLRLALIAAGLEMANALPRPPMRGVPSLSIRIFV